MSTVDSSLDSNTSESSSRAVDPSLVTLTHVIYALHAASLAIGIIGAASIVGAFLFGFSQLIFLVVVLKATRSGVKATDRVWEGAEGLEWTLPSPAPYHTFETAPVVK